MIQIGREEKEWLRKKQPGIVVTSPHSLMGSFHIKATKVGEMEILDSQNPPREGAGYFVDDVFHMRACFGGDVPRVYETDGRFRRIAQKMSDETGESLKTCLLHLHIYGYHNEELCLAHQAEIGVIMRVYPGIEGFFNHLLAPYFYYHAHLAKYGEEPWKGLDHNLAIATLTRIYTARKDPALLAGFLQYAEKCKELAGIRENPDDFLRQQPCWCDAGMRMSECHPDAFRGAQILCRELKARL